MRTIRDVSKRTKNAVKHSIEKLIAKYGARSVRLTAMQIFMNLRDKEKLEKSIKEREQELLKLKEKLK